MKVTEVSRNTSVIYNITLCKACQRKLVNTLQFVRLKSHYTVLGVSQSASQKEIRDAYIKLSKENHPDQNQGDKKSHDRFVQIKEAYEVLSKDSSRRDYDMRMQYTSGTTHGPGHYSSGDFYRDRPYGPFSHGPYGSETSGGYHYNPYNRGTNYQQSAHDPFSEHNYEYYQRQRHREREEKADDQYEKKNQKKAKQAGAEDMRTINVFDTVMWGMIFSMGLLFAKAVFDSLQTHFQKEELKRELERKKLQRQEQAMSQAGGNSVNEAS